jgi:hypothetical protein
MATISHLTTNVIIKPTPTPARPRILFKLFHQTELPLPPSAITPPTTPYLAAKIVYHKLLFSTFNLQHHLASNAKLNSIIILTPKPPFVFLEQIASQLIQDIFLNPLQKKIKYRFSGRNDTCGSLEERKKKID